MCCWAAKESQKLLWLCWFPHSVRSSCCKGCQCMGFDTLYLIELILVRQCNIMRFDNNKQVTFQGPACTLSLSDQRKAGKSLYSLEYSNFFASSSDCQVSV